MWLVQNVGILFLHKFYWSMFHSEIILLVARERHAGKHIVCHLQCPLFLSHCNYNGNILSDFIQNTLSQAYCFLECDSM